MNLVQRKQTEKEAHKSAVDRYEESPCCGCVAEFDMVECGEAGPCGDAGVVMVEEVV